MSENIVDELVNINIDSDTIEGDLSVPSDAQGIVLFAHGAGSSRNSSRNNFVADKLRNDGLATLLVDLLTPEEKEIDKRTREIRFDIDRLAKRVTGTVDWLEENEITKGLRIGIFGSSTGAAGALIAAAKRPDKVETVVSRGGRVDMAEGFLGEVTVPVLCIVGGRDIQVLSMNRQAIEKMETDTELKVIEGAGHLFEEPGALDQVAKLTVDWFSRYLGK